MIEVEILRDAPYGEVLAIQRERFAAMVERRRKGESVEREWLMFVEHRPVYTLGKHGKRSNLLLPERLVREGIEMVEIERGGDITYHGPGQLVVYPLVDFGSRGLGVKDYINLLEESVILTLNDYGIESGREEGATGVWLRNPMRKICAIGVKCSRFVAMHGLALNVTTDLGYFSAINPCGFVDRGVTSIQRELGQPVDWEEVAEKLGSHMRQLLNCDDKKSY